MKKILLLIGGLMASLSLSQSQEQYSGIYPHLAMFNNEGECGTGAVVPWADRLWVITYGPHKPKGSTDKLYEITPDLQQVIRPESIGGTPANRMIHRESNQLFIGPYAIDAQRNVRAIPYSQMFGRLTGNARHLADPAGKIYFATMEEGIYEVDVKTLGVTNLWADEQVKDGRHADLPGYHGKGLYSGQGVLVYANNGEHGQKAQIDPSIPSGVLAGWDGKADKWTVIRRNQFTEITGPGGIYGSDHPGADPVWSVGWDHRSLILMVLEAGQWHAYRLPKASHCYDGAHGWNTEWPRIREIGEKDLLMTMHGMFWRFPTTFSTANSKGLVPRSTYLKIIGDFCRWQDCLVMGCDDTAKNEFLNKRKAKGRIASAQSQSNLWFLKPEQLDQLGPVIGRGAVWLNDPVEADMPSDPFLVAGFGRRAFHLVTSKPATITVEIDREGNGKWSTLEVVHVDGYAWREIAPAVEAVWMRFKSDQALDKATAWITMAGTDPRQLHASPVKFAGVARVAETGITGGLIRAYGGDKRTLGFAAADDKGAIGPYVLDAGMKLVNSSSAGDYDEMQKQAAIPSRDGILTVDEASAIVTEDGGGRFRLPGNPACGDASVLGAGRFCREVVTERDLFNCFGTFYELPARNAGGFKRVRPISSHHLAIKDYCSYRGLLVISGVNLKQAGDNRHIIRSEDGKTGLWVGAIDDLWSLGKPVGVGGPWKNTDVKANEPSDPYLMTGYDRKRLTLESDRATTVLVEVDISGMGDWYTFKAFEISPGKPEHYEFPEAFQAYWVRVRSSVDARATAQFVYE